MEKKTLTIKEIFCGMPRLKSYFQEMDRTIRTFAPSEGKSEGIEELRRKRAALLRTAKEIDRTDLQLLYYLHHLERLHPSKVLSAVKKLFLAQEELNTQILSREPKCEV